MVEYQYGNLSMIAYQYADSLSMKEAKNDRSHYDLLPIGFMTSLLLCIQDLFSFSFPGALIISDISPVINPLFPKTVIVPMDRVSLTNIHVSIECNINQLVLGWSIYSHNPLLTLKHIYTPTPDPSHTVFSNTVLVHLEEILEKNCKLKENRTFRI